MPKTNVDAHTVITRTRTVLRLIAGMMVRKRERNAALAMVNATVGFTKVSGGDNQMPGLIKCRIRLI